MKKKLLILLFFVSAFSFAQLSTDQNDEFTISPNPAKTKLNIKLASADEDVKVEVFDVLGKRVYKGEMTQLDSSINVSNWKSGVYLVRVFNDKTTQIKRFIKQ
ncbi:T9SS type A sorting domain-containing protein [Winogradskyella pulchriflava]|uniref:T9SS type A sorting domain-containing protein n=1 Tax=Winogradskyella pulchriflava TaxID=1110688 RepID=A0ABV6Q7C1_9FLAO